MNINPPFPGLTAAGVAMLNGTEGLTPAGMELLHHTPRNLGALGQQNALYNKRQEQLHQRSFFLHQEEKAFIPLLASALDEPEEPEPLFKLVLPLRGCALHETEEPEPTICDLMDKLRREQRQRLSYVYDNLNKF